MKKYKKLFIMFILFTSIIFGLFPNFVKSQSDISITFDETVNYESSNLNFSSSYNQRNQSTYTNLYNATFDFNNDIIGNNPSGFSTITEIGGSINVIEGIENHNKVLELNDTVNSQIVQAITNFTNILTGTLELFFRTTDSSLRNPFVLRGDSAFFGISIDSNVFNFINFAGNWANTGITAIANQWYHIRIDFDITNSGYEGLTQGYYQYYINNVLFPEVQIYNSPSFIDDLRLYTNGADSNYKTYYDAIGLNWLILSYDDLLNFDNDIVGNEPIGWISANTIGSHTIIKDSLDNRNNILEMKDLFGAGNRAVITKVLNESNSIKQSFQFEVAKSKIIGGNTFFVFLENDIEIIELLITDDDLKYQDGGFQLIKASIFPINTFIVIRIIFYFDIDTMDIYIDNVLEGSGLAFSNNGNNEIDTIHFKTDLLETTGFFTYIDNIYIEPILYQIGGNMIPFLDVSQSIFEVDKNKFDWKNDFITLRDIGSKDINNWTILDTSGTLVDIQIGFPSLSNRRVGIASPGLTVEFIGIEKVFNKSVDIINLTWSINFNSWDVGAKNTSFILFNENNDIITDIEFKNPNLRSNGIIIFGGLGLNTEYRCNLYINFHDNISIIRLSTNTTFIGSEFIPIQNLNSNTLGKVKIISSIQPPGLFIVYWLDDLAVYINGISQAIDFGYFDFFTNKTYFSFLHPLFTFNGIGNISFTIIHGSSHSILRDIKPYSVSTIFNTHERNYFFTDLVSFRLNFNDTLQFTSFRNTGIIAIQEQAILIPTFNSSGVDTETSYFFVDDINNRLRFTHTSDDTNVEFIQISFNLFFSFSTNERTVIFQSNKNNIAFGFFQPRFTDDTSNILELPSFLRTTSAILTQEKTIDSFILTITDNDIDSRIGTTNGFIGNLVFGFGTNFNITVATLSLIAMLIPLLIILLPTIAIGGKLGKNFIVPLFLIMSLLCAITEIIPIWLFFIIGLASTVFILRKKEGVDL